MAKNKPVKDFDIYSEPPNLKPHELGELSRKAAAGDEGGANEFDGNFGVPMDPLTVPLTEANQDWQPGNDEKPEEKKKPGRPKKEKTPPKPPRQTKPIEIRAAAIKKDIFCHFTYDHNLGLGITNEIGVKSEVPIHDDLHVVFRQLVPHLAMIFGALTIDQINSIQPGIEDDPTLLILRKFQIEGFSLDNYDESEGIVLYGSEELPTGTASLETPMIRFFQSRYEHSDALRTALDACIVEVEEYLHGRKRGDQDQLQLGF